MESPRSGYISYAFSFYCLFILFITNTFLCLCASTSFAHLSSVLVESHFSASVLRESLQLLFFLDVSMHLHFIKQSGYLNYLNLLEFRSCLGFVTYLVRGKLQECEGFAIIAKSSSNQRMAYSNILLNYLKKIVTINTTSLAIIAWIFVLKGCVMWRLEIRRNSVL